MPLILAGLTVGSLGCRPAAPPPATPYPTASPPAVSTPGRPAATSTAAATPPAAAALTQEPSLTPTLAVLTYVVQAGDTLSGIALANNVTVESLSVVNGLTGDVIFAGQTLIVPAGTVVPPTPVVSPTFPTGLTILSVIASPNPVERGAEITVTWDVAHAKAVKLWPMTYDRHTGRWHQVDEETEGSPSPAPIVKGAGAGQWTGVVPGDARYSLRFELEAVDVEGRLVTGTTDVVDLVCHDSITGAGYCPLAPKTVAGLYQAFEYGHLIWRSDTNQVVVIPANPEYYLPWSLEPASAASRPIGDPPPGLHSPAPQFAGLWSSFIVTVANLQSATPEQRSLPLGSVLGWALAPEEAYAATIQIDLDNTQSGILNDHLFVTLPDGRVAALILYGGASSTDGPAWTFIEP